MKTFTLLFVVAVAFGVFDIIYAQGDPDPSLWKEAVAFNVFDSIVVDGIILVNELNGSSPMRRKFALLKFFDGSEKPVSGVVEFIDTVIVPVFH